MFFCMIKILIVDDDRVLSKTISKILKAEGFTIKTVHDGESALNKLKNEEFDVMLLDYKLNGKNGLQVLEDSIQSNPELIAIFLTAYASKRVRESAKELGAYSVLDKPFDITKLLNTINAALVHKLIMKDKKTHHNGE